MKLQTFNNFNWKKKKRGWSTSVNSLLSKYLLWDVGGTCPNAKVKSSRAGMGPSSGVRFPVKCPHQKPVACSALVHIVLFFYRSSILDLGNGYCWKICQIVSVKVEMFQFQQICYPPVEKHFTKKFPANFWVCPVKMFLRKVLLWCRTVMSKEDKIVLLELSRLILILMLDSCSHPLVACAIILLHEVVQCTCLGQRTDADQINIIYADQILPLHPSFPSKMQLFEDCWWEQNWDWIKPALFQWNTGDKGAWSNQ